MTLEILARRLNKEGTGRTVLFETVVGYVKTDEDLELLASCLVDPQELIEDTLEETTCLDLLVLITELLDLVNIDVLPSLTMICNKLALTEAALVQLLQKENEEVTCVLLQENLDLVRNTWHFVIKSEYAREFLERLVTEYLTSKPSDYLERPAMERSLVSKETIICLTNTSCKYLASLDLEYIDNSCYSYEQNSIVELFGWPEVAQHFLEPVVEYLA